MVGTPKHSITYPYPALAIGSKLGVRGASWEQVEWGEQAGSEGSKPWPNRGGGHPRTCPHRWWRPQNIPLDLHYLLPPLSPLGVRGASLGPTEVWAPQNLPPQVVGTPKHTPQSPLPPTSVQSIGSEGSKLEVRGASLGPTEVVAIPKLAPTGGGVPKTYPLISITSYLCSVHWEWGEQALAQQRWWAPQNLPPQVVGTPKHTPRSPLPPTSAQSIGSEGSKLEVRGASLGPTEVVATPKLASTGGGVPKT